MNKQAMSIRTLAVSAKRDRCYEAFGRLDSSSQFFSEITTRSWPRSRFRDPKTVA
jgi:hypothetical protein